MPIIQARHPACVLLVAAVAVACTANSAAHAVQAPVALQVEAATQPAKTASKPLSTQDLIASAAPADWRTLDPATTLYVELATGRVVIELAPAFAPRHVANIKALAAGHYWDGLSINRVQDNFVAQWGDPAEAPVPRKPLGKASAKLPAEFARSSDGITFHALPDRDGWADQSGFVDGFPAARNRQEDKTWLTHCYGTVGAGRDLAEDSSDGSELYVVIGQSPRQLDRNITTVGRVVQGIELLSVLPRGTGPLGFYEEPAQRVAIRAITLAADVPAAQRTDLQVMRTDSAVFDAVVESRRNRRDDFYKRPAGHIDVCNVSIPTRATPVAPATASALPRG